jgi:hypothetical protein
VAIGSTSTTRPITDEAARGARPREAEGQEAAEVGAGGNVGPSGTGGASAGTGGASRADAGAGGAAMGAGGAAGATPADAGADARAGAGGQLDGS